jgi:predicted peptidase
MNRAVALGALLTSIVPAYGLAQEPAGRFVERSVKIGEASHAYKVYLPPGFDPARAWPVMLFLHGAGERGTDGVQQTEVGLGRVLRANPERFSTVVVFPQAPPRQVWLGELARVATTALDQTIAEFHGDPDRISLAGLSMGGYGAWLLAFEDPGRWAAIVSVCGGIVPPPGRNVPVAQLPATLGADDPYAATAARVKGIPAWLFHGADDPTVPVTESRRIVAALQQAGASPKYTEYPGVPHNSWDRAFAEPELPKWLLAQRRKSPAAAAR